jgi:hypothetical protein
LEKFQACNPGHQVADLTKGHLDLFIKSLSELAPKTRNHARATLRQFLGWCARKDYLAPSHRLFEADAFHHERTDVQEIEFYTPEELRALLETAEGPMLAAIALSGSGPRRCCGWIGRRSGGFRAMSRLGARLPRPDPAG